jgi:hypothetical protein
MIIDGTYPVYEEDKDYKIFTIKKGKPIPCTINKKTGKIFETIKFMCSIGGHDKYYELEDYEDYRDVSLLEKTMNLIKELAEKRMIQIEE